MRVLIVAAALLASACVSAPAPPVAQRSPTPSPSASGAPVDRVAGWTADLDALLAARDNIHPDGWHGQPRAAWLAQADAVKASLPALTDAQALVAVVRLAAAPSYGGRDGHSGIFPFVGATHAFPLQLWQFPAGLVVTGASPPYADLVGATVVAVNGHPAAEVLRAVEPLTPRDNPSSLLAYSTLYLRSPDLLVGLGLIDRVGPTSFSLVDRAGRRRTQAIAPVPAAVDNTFAGGAPHTLPTGPSPWLARQHEVLWSSYLADSRTLYVQYNQVRPVPGDALSSLLARARRPDVDRVVLDLRNNGGGDNHNNAALEEVLADPSIDRKGHLLVLIGRLTFSAAANLATDLEQSTSAVFVGEPLGGSPNLYGDADPIALPWGGLTLYMATRYWERSTPDDPRVTIEPDVRVPLTLSDWLAGRDPVLAAATRFRL